MSSTIYELDPTYSYLGLSVRHVMVTQQRGQLHGVISADLFDAVNHPKMAFVSTGAP
jgi:polyisoprenoid-binding protein YceI